MGLNLQSVRCSFALDSQVALGALVKGRSSSGALNSLLRRSLPVYLGSDLYPTYGFYPTSTLLMDLREERGQRSPTVMFLTGGKRCVLEMVRSWMSGF